MVGRVVGMVSVFVGFFGDFSQIRRAVPKNFRQSSLDFFEGHLEYFCEINEVFWCIALRSDILKSKKESNIYKYQTILTLKRGDYSGCTILSLKYFFLIFSDLCFGSNQT